MTAAAGLVFEDHVYLAADSAASDGDTLFPRQDRKLFVNQEYAIAFCGSYRTGQVAQYAFIPPELPDSPDDMHRTMVTQFIPNLISCLRDGEAIDDKCPATMSGELLVGVMGQLFTIDSDFHVGISQDFDAIGSGASIARGSLLTLRRISWGLPPAARLELAIGAAITYSTTCGGDIHYLSTWEAQHAELGLA